MSSPAQPLAVVITGASTGIGRAAALHLDGRGFRVFATVRNAPDAEALRAAASPMLQTVRLDVTDAASVQQAAEAVGAAVGAAGLDGLVNNAGIAEPGPLEFLPLDRLRRQLEVNVTGLIAVTQAMLPLVRRARGRIVNIGSIGGRSTMPFAGAYCASKYALEALNDALRMELRASGIEVSLIEPGGIATPIWDKAINQALPAEGAASYGPALSAMKEAVGQVSSAGLAPEAVAAVIEKALTARRPKTRYLVGRMAYVRLLLQWLLPDRARDAVLLRRLAGTADRAAEG